MKKVGVLYICTGPYSRFWDGFYSSFEKNFLLDCEKHYFVFTDSEGDIENSDRNVTVVKIDALPWPLITLLRFRTFLNIEDILRKYDYLVFANANMKCDSPIFSEEFLPRKELGESIAVTLHPGYVNKHITFYPYERRRISLAYIPWNCGTVYVIGAMIAGTSEAFLEMSKTLKWSIEEDLKKNVIAKWHDESHLNRYIIRKDGIRLLPPSYCYPSGGEPRYQRKIYAVDKKDVFDVDVFKGNYEKIGICEKVYLRLKKKLTFVMQILYVRDVILKRNVDEMKMGND